MQKSFTKNLTGRKRSKNYIMLRLRFSKKKIKTVPDGRTTKCYLTCQVVETKSKNILNEFAVVSWAKCSKFDTPDPRLGALVAESKAKQKAYRQAEMYAQGYLQLVKAEDFKDFKHKMTFYQIEEFRHERLLEGYPKDDIQ